MDETVLRNNCKSRFFVGSQDIHISNQPSSSSSSSTFDLDPVINEKLHELKNTVYGIIAPVDHERINNMFQQTRIFRENVHKVCSNEITFSDLLLPPYSFKDLWHERKVKSGNQLVERKHCTVLHALCFAIYTIYLEAHPAFLQSRETLSTDDFKSKYQPSFDILRDSKRRQIYSINKQEWDHLCSYRNTMVIASNMVPFTNNKGLLINIASLLVDRELYCYSGDVKISGKLRVMIYETEGDVTVKKRPQQNQKSHKKSSSINTNSSASSSHSKKRKQPSDDQKEKKNALPSIAFKRSLFFDEYESPLTFALEDWKNGLDVDSLPSDLDYSLVFTEAQPDDDDALPEQAQPFNMT